MKISDLFVTSEDEIKKIMHVIDKNGQGIALVVDDAKLVGIITDSDIRRSIMAGDRPTTKAESIMNKEPLAFPETTSESVMKHKIYSGNHFTKIPEHGSLLIPLLNSQETPVDICFFSSKGIEGRITESPLLQRSVYRVLIVGGAGYLGSVLSDKLLRQGFAVRVLDNLTYGDAGLKAIYHYPNFEFVQGDMRNIETLTQVIEGVDAVIHLAAIVGDPACELKPSETIQANYLATKALAELCKFAQINRFIFASTCSVYGASKGEEELTEESELHPVSLYADMKLKSEQAIMELADSNFRPTIFRMGTLFGSSFRNRFDLVVNTLTIRAIKDQKFTIFGGEQWRAFCNVHEAANCYIKTLKAPMSRVGTQIFNIVGLNATINTVGKQVKKLVEKVDSSIKVDLTTDKLKVDNRNYIVSAQKFKDAAHFEFYSGLTEGILQVIGIAKDIKDYTDKKYSNYLWFKGENEN